jgi:hypothetical protein
MTNEELEGISAIYVSPPSAPPPPSSRVAKLAYSRHVASGLRDAYGIRATEKRSDLEAIESKVRGPRERCLAGNIHGSCKTPTPMLQPTIPRHATACQ